MAELMAWAKAKSDLALVEPLFLRAAGPSASVMVPRSAPSYARGARCGWKSRSTLAPLSCLLFGVGCVVLRSPVPYSRGDRPHLGVQEPALTLALAPGAPAGLGLGGTRGAAVAARASSARGWWCSGSRGAGGLTPARRGCAAAAAATEAEILSFPLCRVALGLEPAADYRVPVWLFRQAGRHLPEYMAFKAERGMNFLDILNDPAAVAEVTMQPLRRYAVDAAILFSDILVVPEALGINVEMPGGKGILVTNPLTGPEDLARLPKVDEAATPAFIQEKLGHVLEAVRAILAQMRKEGFGSRPLIGFSAAPWTLLYYMVGSSSKTLNTLGEEWCQQRPEAAKELMALLTKVVIEYMSAQVREGCHALQVFEAMGEHMSPETFRTFALPAMAEIARELRSRHPGVPLMVFPRGACYGIAELQSAGYDVITVDTETDLATAVQTLREEAERTGGRVATLQGNFNPKWLRPGEGGTPDAVRSEVQAMLAASGALGAGPGAPRLIANLGEGLSGKESPELVTEFVNAIHELSRGPSA